MNERNDVTRSVDTAESRERTLLRIPGRKRCASAKQSPPRNPHPPRLQVHRHQCHVRKRLSLPLPLSCGCLVLCRPGQTEAHGGSTLAPLCARNSGTSAHWHWRCACILLPWPQRADGSLRAQPACAASMERRATPHVKTGARELSMPRGAAGASASPKWPRPGFS